MAINSSNAHEEGPRGDKGKLMQFVWSLKRPSIIGTRFVLPYIFSSRSDLLRLLNSQKRFRLYAPHCTSTSEVKRRFGYGSGTTRRHAFAKRLITRITRSYRPSRRESAWHEAEVVTQHD